MNVQRIILQTNVKQIRTMRGKIYEYKTIIMKRDGLTEQEADEMIAQTKNEIEIAMGNGDFDLVEDIIMGDLGLETDYFMELI